MHKLRIVERAGIGAEQFPVSFHLNTGRLIQDGRMRADGADVRITVGEREIPFQMEGLNTACTRMTFPVDLMPDETREDVFLHYGNPDAAAPGYDRGWITGSSYWV